MSSLNYLQTQSLQLTVKRVLGSGDAAALANVSLSNCQLLKLMHGNHQKLEIALEELQNVKNSLKGRIKSGLGSLAVLQQDMTEVHTKVQFHCSQLQMTRRRFEVLEQICAAPDMMASVLGEIHWRKSFKSFFVEVNVDIDELVVIYVYRKGKEFLKSLSSCGKTRRTGGRRFSKNADNILFYLFFLLSLIESLVFL